MKPVTNIKVLIVDSSAAMRRSLAGIMCFDPGITVMGLAGNPFAAARIMKQEIPDVILLDPDTPGMDGLTFLRKIMTQHPIPVVINAGISGRHIDMLAKAMEYGAADVVNRELYFLDEPTEESKVLLCDKVKSAAAGPASGKAGALPVPNAPAPLIKVPSSRGNGVIVIGASTGGTQAIEVLLEKLTPDTPGIVIVQHMKEYFTRLFAQRLDELSGVLVKEAEHLDEVVKGQVLIAPGNKHILLRKKAGGYYIELAGGPLVSRHRPSVDVLFTSAAESAGKDALGILLTGMGRDGAKGLLKMKEAGAVTIAQDEKSCVVFGMPREAIELQAAEKILPLHDIASYVISTGYTI